MNKFKPILILIIIIFVYFWISNGKCCGSECLPSDIQKIYECLKLSEQKLPLFGVTVLKRKWPELKYNEEETLLDYWKAPFETERDGQGDCVDLTLWLLKKLTDMGYDCWMIFGIDEGYNQHAWLRIKLKDGTYWDIDMSGRFIKRAFFPNPLTMWDYMKLQEVIERQEAYEKANQIPPKEADP